MTTFREKIEPRKQAAKNIGQNLVELAWLFFVAAQWVAAVAVPLFAAIYLIGWLIGRPMSITFNGIALMSARGIVFAVLFWAVCATFAAGYLFKIRRGDEPALGTKSIIMVLYASILLMLAAHIKLSEYQYVLKNIRYNQTTVRLFDADSKQPLEQTSFAVGSDQIPTSVLPTHYTASSRADDSYVFSLLNIQPMQVSFSAAGYLSKNILIGQPDSEEPLKVYLEKEPDNDPNAPPQ